MPVLWGNLRTGRRLRSGKIFETDRPFLDPYHAGARGNKKYGRVKFVYRDFPFLGPESIRSAEAGWCAEEQGKFWEYHDYLYGHQKGENKGAFSDTFLKSFAKNLGLDTSAFDACLDSTSYTEVVLASKAEGAAAGVTGTPKGFILKSGKIVSTIDGAESWVTVKPKIDSALK